MKRAVPFVLIVAVLAGSLMTVWYLKRSASQNPRTVLSGPPAPTNRTNSITIGADPPHTLGDPGAAVMLEEFGDFQCPPCGSLHPILKELKAEFGRDVVIVFREFPIVAAHPNALSAARAAEAAGLQNKFWEMHHLLYENQKTWHDAADVQPIFEEYATRIGLDLDRFRRDLPGSVVNQRINLDRERGYSIGVNSTPTVFLNGREVVAESLTPDKLRGLMQAELKSARSK